MMEGAQRQIQEDDLKVLLTFYEVPEERWADYLCAASEARKRGWWESHGTHTDESWAQDFVGMEQGAELLRVYQPGVVHGLLQTPDYATALFKQIATPVSEEKIRRRVQQRIRRQTAIADDVDPLHVWAVLDEAVLWRLVGNNRVMADQIAHIADLTENSDAVKVQVVRFSTGGGNQAAQGAFTIINSSLPGDFGTVYIEHPSGGYFLEGLSDVDSYGVLFEHLADIALPPDESTAYLRLKGEEYRR